VRGIGRHPPTGETRVTAVRVTPSPVSNSLVVMSSGRASSRSARSSGSSTSRVARFYIEGMIVELSLSMYLDLGVTGAPGDSGLVDAPRKY